MKMNANRILAITVVMVFLTSRGFCGCGGCGYTTREGVGQAAVKDACPCGTTVTTAEMAALVDDGKAVVLDARPAKYDDGRRIPTAKLVGTEPSAAQVAALVSDKNALVVTYCTNLQCGASKKLGKHLRKLGYTNVKEYHEGIEGWVAAGKPVETAGTEAKT